MRNKRHIIVTGGAGFIGSHIAKRLLSDGYRVTVLDNLSTGRLENVPKKADFIKIDLGRDSAPSRLKKLNAAAVLHLAGQSSGEASFKDPLYDLRSHVMSTFNLLDMCRKQNIGRFLYASSMSTYGDPDYMPVDESHPQRPKTFYGAAKASAEAYIKLYRNLGVDTTIFRLFSVYGPGQNLDNKMQGMISIYLSFMLEGSPIIVKGSPKRFRDFVYVDDVVDAWIRALDKPIAFGKIYNVAGGKRTTVAEVLTALKAALGRKDYPIEFAGNTPGDQFGVSGDVSLIKRELGWRPAVGLREGLKKMVDFEMGRLEIG